jgi:multidrug efflux system membrane fusion protein
LIRLHFRPKPSAIGALALLMLPLATMAAFPLSSARAQPAHTAQEGVPVSIVEAARQNLPIRLTNIGAVQANQSVLIRARVDGTIERIMFTEGQEVKAGTPIVQLDPRPYQAVLDQANAKLAADQAQLANARIILGRSTQLASRSYAPQATVDTQAATVAQLAAQIKSDQAAIDAAKLNLDYTTIRAPFDGRMGLRQMDPGTVVRFADTSGAGIVTISQIHPIAVVFSLPQQELPAVQAALAEAGASGGSVPVTAYRPDGGSGRSGVKLSTGTLLAIDNAIDASSGTIRLKALFANTDDKLWPGQFVQAEVLVGTRRNVLTVPSIAVQHAEGRRFVYQVLPDSTVRAQTVTLAGDDGNVAVIASGLEPGAKVVVNGQSRLRQGTRVSIIPAKADS